MDPPVPDPRGMGIGKKLLYDEDLAFEIISAIRSEFPTLSLFFKMKVLDSPLSTIAFINRMAAAGATRVIIHMHQIESTL